MSKVIFKMTFKHPNLKDTVSKNVSHVNYIATRSGVDKTITEADLRRELEKGVEDLSSDDSTYVKYIDERPQSHGLFGEEGIEDPKIIQEEIENVKSCVWRGIISLKEDDAIKLGYLAKDQWQDMLRKKMPDVAHEMGIKVTNLRWVGAIHMAQGHPHAHVMIWEKEPERIQGIVSKKALNSIRKTLTDEIFESERFQLLNEKNLMRDLLKESALNDVSEATKLLKEMTAAGKELEAFFGSTKQPGISPKMFNKEEQELAEKIKHLADIMPGKGRIALKFMPENVKEEVKSIADYLLKQPVFEASLEKNLKAVEELTKMYTGKEEDIQKARDNAYKDVRDRLSQVILKGAAESLKKNIFYVDQALSQRAIGFIKNLTEQINLVPEQLKVLNEIANALVKVGHTDEQILELLKGFIEDKNLDFSQKTIEDLIKQVRDDDSNSQNINNFSSGKTIEHYLSILKAFNYEEAEAIQVIRKTIKKENEELGNKLQQLKEKGILNEIDGKYKLTEKGVEELLKIKDLDRVEREILKTCENRNVILSSASFKDLLDDKDVFDNLHDKDPKELVISKFDLKVSEEFGEFNSLTFKELEKKIYEKYTDQDLNVNEDKADLEIDLYEKRIEKLTLNGYVKFDKATEIYSFTDEGFEALNNIKDRMEFTRYDANITLSYIDKAENNILNEDRLKEFLDKEIVNQAAKKYYESFTSILESGQSDKYINVSSTGELSSTEEGQSLGKELSKLNKYFYECKGEITEDKLKDICIRDFGERAKEQVDNIIERLEKEVTNGHIQKDQNDGVYSIDPAIKDINQLLYQIYKEGGSLNKDNLKDVLEKNVPNREAKIQLKYLIKRLDNLKEQGYLSGKDKTYSLNQKGLEKREDLLVPQRDLLRDKIKYLMKLGLLRDTEQGYEVTEKYYSYMRNVVKANEAKTPRISLIFSKDIATVIERTQDKIDVDKIERINQRFVTGKYVNDAYKEIKTDYESIRENCNVVDTVTKSLNNLSTTLLVSGVDLMETKEILQQWSIKTGFNIDTEKLTDIVDKAYEIVKENNLWGQTTVISKKDWNEMFINLNIDEKDIPVWIFKGENWEALNHGVGLGSIINNIWKSGWKELEQQRMQSANQAELMKKELVKQAALESKEARIEQMRKSQDKGSMYHDDEFER